MRPALTIKVYNRIINYPIRTDNVCNDLKVGKCPLKTGDPVTFVTKFRVPDNIPTPLRPALQMTLWNDNNKLLLCFIVQTVIKNGS